MQNPETVSENETHKVLCDFEIQTDHLISTRQPDDSQQKEKRTCRIVDFDVPADCRVKIKEKREINTKTLLEN